MLALAIIFSISQNKQEVFKYSQLERDYVTGVFTIIMLCFTEQVSCKSPVSYCAHQKFWCFSKKWYLRKFIFNKAQNGFQMPLQNSKNRYLFICNFCEICSNTLFFLNIFLQQKRPWKKNTQKLDSVFMP